MRIARRLRFGPWVLAAGLAAAGAHECVADRTGPAAASARVKDAGRSTPGKPQPPISVDSRLSAAPAVGVELIVTITARADSSLGALALEVRPDSGVSVPAPPVAVAVERAEERVWRIRATPLVPGAARLNVLVTAAGGAGRLARAIVVPVDTAAPARSAAVRVAESGERTVTLPAQERALDGSR